MRLSLLSISVPLLIALSSCREIPPVIPADYIGGPVERGWPPVPAYAADPLDPRNRWFHRAFSARGPLGEVLGAHGDEPVANRAPASRADAAESMALLERIAIEEEAAAMKSTGGEDLRARDALESHQRRDYFYKKYEKVETESKPAAAPPRLDPVSAAVFHSDVLAEACRVGEEARAGGSQGAHALLLARVARRTALPAPGALPPSVPPAPPLRTGTWIEAKAVALGPGLVPSAQDIRWSRVYEEEGGTRQVLLRLRTGLDRDGAPVLLELPSECWERDTARGPEACRVYRWDRAEWVSGRDPWRELPAAQASPVWSAWKAAEEEARRAGTTPGALERAAAVLRDLPGG